MDQRHAPAALKPTDQAVRRHCLCCRLLVVAEMPDPEPPRVHRCTVCGRSWLIGAAVPLDCLILYVTQLALSPLPDAAGSDSDNPPRYTG